MPSSSDNQARLHHAYADLLDDAAHQNGSSVGLLPLVGDLDRLLAPYRLANPPAELSRSIDLLAREMASNGSQHQAPKHFWQIGPFGNRGGGRGRPNHPSDDNDPERPRRWSLGRELAGIAAVIVILALVGGALVAVFRGQNGSSGSPASSASPVVTHHYPPLPENSIYNPGARAVYDAGLGKHINRTFTSNGYTLTVHWVYADAVQAIVYYSITPPPDRHPTAIGSRLSVTDAASAHGPAEPGSPGGGIPLSPDGRADFLYATQGFQPFTSKGDTITLILTFSGTHVGSPGPGGQVTDGTTMQVTVPFDPGRSIVVDKQGTTHSIEVKLDRVIVAPSGVMAMLSYPNAKSISIHQWIEALAKLSDGVNSDAQEQGPINIPERPSVLFPTPPPASLNGNWSLNLRPYESSGKLSTDRSEWLTLSFPVGDTGTSSSIPDEIQNTPDALKLYKAGLGLTLNQSVKAGDATVILDWIYADPHEVMAAYTVTGLSKSPDKSSASARLAAQNICGPGSLSVKLDGGSVKMLGGSESGGPIGASTQSCLVSEDVYFSGDNLSAVTPVTIAVQGKTSTDAASSFSLSAKVQLVPGRATAVHQSASAAGKTLTLDGVDVTPTGVRLFLAGNATEMPYFPNSRFAINGRQTGIATIGGTSTRWSASGDRVYDLSYDDPGWEKPWTIKVMPATKITNGTPTIASDQAATFTFNPPTAGWDAVLSPTATTEPASVVSPTNTAASHSAVVTPTPTPSPTLTPTPSPTPNSSPSSSTTPTILAAQSLPSTLKTDGRSIGNPNAPVKVVEWGDYQCSSCDYFYRNGQTQFLNDYVATGKVYYTFRDYPFFGQQSENAAAAAWCANDQGKYWAFHDTMYGNQPPENTNQITDTFLKTVASSIGLNMQQFNSCYDSGKYKSKVNDDLDAANKLHSAGTLNGTPTFYVNGTAVESANYSDLKAAIDKALQP